MSVGQVSVNNNHKLHVSSNNYVSQKAQVSNKGSQVVQKTENKDDKSNLLMKGLVAAGVITSGVLLVRSGKLNKIIEQGKNMLADSNAFATKVQRLWKNKNLTSRETVTFNKSGYMVDINTKKKFTGRVCDSNLDGASIIDVKDGIVTKKWNLVWDHTKHSYRCTERANIIHDPKVTSKKLQEMAKSAEEKQLKTAAKREKIVGEIKGFALDCLETLVEEVLTKVI